MIRFSRKTIVAVAAAAAMTLTACSEAESNNASTSETQASAAATTTAAENGTVTVTDNYGEKTVPTPPKRVVALDNRTFELLDSWGVKPVAAPKKLVSKDVPGLRDNDDIADIGNHKEPNLEIIVAADPDVIISGQRFEKYDDEIQKLVPNAVLVDFEPRDDEPFDRELIRQTLELGEIFGKQAEAEKTVEDFTKAVQRARDAYDPAQTVMAVNVSGGEIGYVAPGIGRTFGPLFDLIVFTPGLKVQNASIDHKGDDISVEAIADSNPDWIFALDRDAAIKKEGESPAALSVLSDSAALQNVTAVKENHIYVAPQDTYINESILTYTEILNGIADQLEAAK